MTYGALVVQLIQDYEDYAEVNKQLDLMYASRITFLCSCVSSHTSDSAHTNNYPGDIILVHD